jgi:hypothetical protein
LEKYRDWIMYRITTPATMKGLHHDYEKWLNPALLRE